MGETVGGGGRDKVRLQICLVGKEPSLLTGTALLLAKELLGVLVDREEETLNGVSVRPRVTEHQASRKPL